jgi:beta propeller repeat protein
MKMVEGRSDEPAARTGVSGALRKEERRRLAIAGAVLATLALALLILWVSTGAALGAQRCEDPPGGGDVYAVSTTENEKAAPATDGEIVVWAENVSGAWRIWARQLRVEGSRGLYRPRELATCGTKPSNLSLSNDTVIWQEGESPDGTIWACSVWGDPWVVTDGDAAEPAADDGYVVWVDYSTDPAGDIAGTRLGNGDFGIVTVCAAPGAQRAPAVSGAVAVWQDARGGGWDIWGCSLRGEDWLAASMQAATKPCHPLDPGVAVAVCDAAGDQTAPAIWEDVVAWQDDRGDDSDIWAAWAAGEAGCERSAVRMHDPQPIEFDVGPVCTAAGDQTEPTLSSPVVFWTDRRDGDADIRAYDLASEASGVVCDEPKDQIAPSAGGDAAVWLDGRRGAAVKDVYGADVWTTDDDTPPFAPEWTDEEIVTLFLAVFYELGVFDEVRFSTDGGETWGDWQPLSDVVKLPLTEGEGTYEIALMLRGDSGEFGPVTFVVRVDKKAPVADAPTQVKARKGQKVALRVRVRDNMSPSADLIIKVKDRHGKVVRRLVVGDVATGKKVTRKLSCSLHRGVYHMTLRARDLAGNVQKKADTVRLVVR